MLLPKSQIARAAGFTPSTIADADTIFVLEHGRLAESGSHAALLRRDGLYAEMWNRQLAERDEALDEAAE